ncbi:hypothetical protein ABPG72_021248 [Tetrahymena utriculariae]
MSSEVSNSNQKVKVIKPQDDHLKAILKDLTAGSIAGLAICLTGHPFDTLKVRLQMGDGDSSLLKCIKQMYVKEGILSYFKGMESPLVTVPLVNAIVFGAYELYKKITHTENTERFTFFGGLCAGMFAGFVNCIVIGPIELAKCRLQMQKETILYKGPFDCFAQIYRNEGIKGIYRGMVATQFREIPAYGAQFASYELYKSSVIKYINHGKDLSHFQTLIGGGFGGIMCWVFSYPQDIIKTKLQCQTSPIKGMDGGFFKVGRQIISEDGVKGLWKGFSACLTRAFYANSIGFVAYEYSKKILQDNLHVAEVAHSH